MLKKNKKYEGKHINVKQLTEFYDHISAKHKTKGDMKGYLLILCRISEYFSIYIIKLYKARPFQRLRFKKTKASIRFTPPYVSGS